MTPLPIALFNNVPWKKVYQIVKSGAPVPIVGAKLRMQFRLSPDSEEVAIDLSTENGFLRVVDAANGIWAFDVSMANALQVPAGNYVHDMIVYPASGDPFLAHYGPAVISQGVTREYDRWN